MNEIKKLFSLDPQVLACWKAESFVNRFLCMFKDVRYEILESWGPPGAYAIIAESLGTYEKNRGNACLSLMKNHLKKRGLPKVLLEFNRIHTDIEGRGLGTLLMHFLCAFADQRGFAIYDRLNPYGSLNMESLIRFNKKFGFQIFSANKEGEKIISCGMIRKHGSSELHRSVLNAAILQKFVGNFKNTLFSS